MKTITYRYYFILSEIYRLNKRTNIFGLTIRLRLHWPRIELINISMSEKFTLNLIALIIFLY